MRNLRPFAAVLASLAFIVLAGAAAPTFRESFAAGTLYTIHFAHSPRPTQARGLTQAAADTEYVAHVAWAADRGRMDIVSGGEPAMFKAGDYILFDTTQYIVVHPSAKTFSTLPDLSAMSSQLANMMKLSDVKLSVDTLERGTVNGVRATHYRTNMSFTMTMDMSSFGVSGTEAPPPMSSVVRNDVWYADSTEETPNPFMKGPEQMPSIPFISPIVDEMKKLRSSLPVHRLVVKMQSSAHVNAMGNETTTHSAADITEMRRGDVDVTRLVLPAEYTQAAFAGMEMLGPPVPLPPEVLAKWRAVPK